MAIHSDKGILIFRNIAITASIILMFIGISQPAALATKVDSVECVEEAILNADFIGVVQTERAAGGVAPCSVLESWKGPAKGTKVMIRLTGFMPEDPYPCIAQGRVFVAFATSATKMQFHEKSVLLDHPLWWRPIAADYSLLPGCEVDSFYAEPSREKLQILKDKTPEILKLGASDPEAILLKASLYCGIAEYASMQRSGTRDRWKESEIQQMRDALSKCARTSDVLEELSRIINADKSSVWLPRIEDSLYRHGGKVTEEWLGKSAKNGDFGGGERRKNAIDAISLRRALDASSYRRRERVEGTASPDESIDRLIDKMTYNDIVYHQHILACDGMTPRFDFAFKVLTRREPELIARYLTVWPAESGMRHAYNCSSYFGWKCSVDRVQNIGMLVDARNPIIQVAGSIYVAFDDKEKGDESLGRMVSIKGDPGAWAALALVRRGRTEHVPRLLEVFQAVAHDDKYSMRSFDFHRSLQRRVAILMVNSSIDSGIQYPDYLNAVLSNDITKDAGDVVGYENIKKWWDSNRRQIRIDTSAEKMLSGVRID